MKKLYILAFLLFATFATFAQGQDFMSYQAVIRNTDNTLVANHKIGIQVSILQGSFAGTAVYTETQMLTSNANGLVTMEIGGGNAITGSYNTINWANGPYFLKTEIDPTGGTSYTITGTSQLMSVPCALYAKTSGSSVPGPKGDKGAVGLTGADANIIPASKRPVKDIDYGFAGDVKARDINESVLDILLQQNITPVIAPLTHDGKGQILNTNADTIASSLAVALSRLYDVRLIYCFEKKGILTDVEDDNSVINLITKEKYGKLLEEKRLFDGILPKIDNAFLAIDNGVKEVLIGHADDLLQNLTANTKGTLIK